MRNFMQISDETQKLSIFVGTFKGREAMIFFYTNYLFRVRSSYVVDREGYVLEDEIMQMRTGEIQ